MLITFTTVTHTPPQPLHDGHNDHNSDMLNNAKSGDSYKNRHRIIFKLFIYNVSEKTP